MDQQPVARDALDGYFDASGGGIDTYVTTRLSIRLTADYRGVFSSGRRLPDLNQFRPSSGVVVGIGSR